MVMCFGEGPVIWPDECLKWTLRNLILYLHDIKNMENVTSLTVDDEIVKFAMFTQP